MTPIDFQSAVLDRSHEIPVVVDFWAPWCGPCRTLGPIIEALAAEAGGRWELVKLDTDEQPEVAQAYGIRGIPAVKMFDGGEVVAEFTGVLPRGEIRTWLDSNLPDLGLERLDAIVAGWETGGGAAIRAAVEAFVEENPDSVAGHVRLAQAMVAEDPERARELTQSVDPGDDLEELATDVASLADLMQERNDVPDRLRGPLDRARAAFREHDLNGTLEHLVEAVTLDRSFADEMARRAAVALFRILGRDHQLTREHQRRLAMVLHS